MRLKKTIFKKAARKVSEEPAFACLSISDVCARKNIEEYKGEEAMRHRAAFEKLFRPYKMDPQGGFFGDIYTGDNQLARSLALLLAAEILGGKKYET